MQLNYKLKNIVSCLHNDYRTLAAEIYTVSSETQPSIKEKISFQGVCKTKLSRTSNLIGNLQAKKKNQQRFIQVTLNPCNSLTVPNEILVA